MYRQKGNKFITLLLISCRINHINLFQFIHQGTSMVLDLGYNISLIYLNLSDFFEKSNVITRPSKSKAHFSF